MAISDDPTRQEFREALSGRACPAEPAEERAVPVARPPEDVRNGKALNGKRVILVQATAGRLGMYVMGQALFSRHLMEEWFRSREVEPESLRSVIVCTDGDSDLEPLLKRYDLELFVAKSRSKPR